MFIDASAIVAILDREPGWEVLSKCIDDAKEGVAVTPTVRFEAVLALARLSAQATGRRPSKALLLKANQSVGQFLRLIGAQEIAITSEIGLAAIDACATYGKVVGHPAKLNFGDCFAYAAAKSRGETLLFVGGDFSQTDLRAAVGPAKK
jgi:ribonuclease VapC